MHWKLLRHFMTGRVVADHSSRRTSCKGRIVNVAGAAYPWPANAMPSLARSRGTRLAGIRAIAESARDPEA
jgi:hypothetical protein